MRTLNIMAQTAIFTLSPLIVPSILCTGLVLISLFEASILVKFSTPFVFAMVLVILPAVVTGLIASLIRTCISLSHHYLGKIIWVISAIIIGGWMSAKFMSWISIHFIVLGMLSGMLSALIACLLIIVLEHFRSTSPNEYNP